jgi:hypothetical protein
MTEQRGPSRARESKVTRTLLVRVDFALEGHGVRGDSDRLLTVALFAAGLARELCGPAVQVCCPGPVLERDGSQQRRS